MNHKHYLLAVVALLVVLLAAACSAPAPAQPAAAPTNPPAEPPTQAQAPAPAQPQPVQPSVAAQAPICQANTACSALTAEQNQLDCVKKVPYTNVLLPQGTKWEVLDKTGAFTCSDSGMVVNGKVVLTCHGPVLMSFQLKLTNAACDTSGLQTGTGQCQQGYGYDAAQNCCSPVAADGGSGTVVTVNMGGCPTPVPGNP